MKVNFGVHNYIFIEHIKDFTKCAVLIYAYNVVI